MIDMLKIVLTKNEQGFKAILLKRYWFIFYFWLVEDYYQYLSSPISLNLMLGRAEQWIKENEKSQVLIESKIK
jgi:hypothetical protein